MTRGSLVQSRTARRLALLLALVAALVLLWVGGPSQQTSVFGSAGSHDLVEYWAAARLLVQGGNPYDPDALLAIEQSAGWPEPEPLLMWNPPWTLALVLPLSVLPFGASVLVWLLLQLALLLGSGLILWRVFATGDQRYWIGLILAAGFLPGLLALRMGQISPWQLVGVVGFLWAARARRDLAAGAALALLTIKPHVTYLFLLVALWWAWRYRRPRVWAGWLAALAAGGGLVLALSPDIYANYLAVATQPPLYWSSPTLGTWLRLFFGESRQWLQFLPTVLGGLAACVWVWRFRGSWRWATVAPPLLLASDITAAYGWAFDQVILLPAVVSLVSHVRGARAATRVVILLALGLIEVTMLIQNLHAVNAVFYVWHPLALAGLYWWSARLDRGADQLEPASRGGVEQVHANGVENMTTIKVENLTREKTVVSAGRVADNILTRLRGLIGHRPLEEGEGLLIVPCNSIHTHFMGFPIDVLYVDRSQKVVAIDHDMKPWRFGRIRRGARFVIELPAGTVQAAGTQVGDQLRVEGYKL